MIGAPELLDWHPRIRREPHPCQDELRLDAADDLAL
jgi:hypothetical protein